VAIQPLTGKVGKIKARKFKSMDYSDPVTNAVAVEFESSFTKVPAAAETIILKLEADGKWHVASYSIN
jgi:hypothetical protein